MIDCKFEDGNKAYPGLRHVTVDNIILNKEKTKVLLVRRGPKYSHPHKLATPGGFLSRDETTEESSLREIREETGYDAKIINLFCIVDKPNRKGEDRQNVTFVYIVEALEKVGEWDHEIEGIEWHDLDNLPTEEEFAFDHYERLKLYLEHLKNPFPLPKIVSN